MAEELRELQLRVDRLAHQREQVKETTRALQADQNRLELDWLRQDITMLSHQVDRRHAFLTSVRDRARHDNELVLLVERRAATARESLRVQREREQFLQTQRQQRQDNADNAASEALRRANSAVSEALRLAVSSDPHARTGTTGEPSWRTAEGMLEGILRSTLVRQEAEAMTVLRLQQFPMAMMEAKTQILPQARKVRKSEEKLESEHHDEGKCALFCRCAEQQAEQRATGPGEQTQEEGGGEEEEECAVCLSVMVGGDRVIRLRCGHAYHWACLKPWLLRRRQDACCPKCKQRVLSSVPTDALHGGRGPGGSSAQTVVSGGGSWLPRSTLAGRGTVGVGRLERGGGGLVLGRARTEGSLGRAAVDSASGRSVGAESEGERGVQASVGGERGRGVLSSSSGRQDTGGSARGGGALAGPDLDASGGARQSAEPSALSVILRASLLADRDLRQRQRALPVPSGGGGRQGLQSLLHGVFRPAESWSPS